MPNDSLAAFSQRSIAIVAEAVARFELMLDSNLHLLTENEKRIATWLQGGLSTSKVLLRGQLQAIQSESQPTDTTYRLAFSRILNFLEPLQAYHQRLRHLPIPALLRESVVFVERAWAALANHSGQTVSLCLANEFEPSEHHLEEQQRTAQTTALFGGDKTVVALAKIDYANPLNWPLLLHEFGHAAIRGQSYENTKHLSSYELSWLLELGCDRIAMRLCGPAYVAAYAAQATFKLAYFVASAGHPAPGHRAEILRASAPDWVKSARLFQSVEPLLDARLRIEDELQGELPDTIALICPACTNHVADYSRAQREDFTSVVDDFFKELDALVTLNDRSATSDTTLQALEQRLAAGVLIGSSCHDRDALNVAYDKAQLKRQRKEELTEDELRTLKNSACDTPNNVFDIIHAGWNHYLRVSASRIESLQQVSLSEDKKWEDAWLRFRQDVVGVDQLLLSSIETSEFHGLMGELRNYGDAQ